VTEYTRNSYRGQHVVLRIQHVQYILRTTPVGPWTPAPGLESSVCIGPNRGGCGEIFSSRLVRPLIALSTQISPRPLYVTPHFLGSPSRPECAEPPGWSHIAPLSAGKQPLGPARAQASSPKLPRQISPLVVLSFGDVWNLCNPWMQ